MAISTSADVSTNQHPAPGAAGTERSATPAVRLERVEKRFGDVVAVAGIDLDVADGEFFSMLGPSGSGKTTTLRMIAGFELPTSGRILLHGEDVSRRAPFERDVNTVFQDYALFPHMRVGDNVAYGLVDPQGLARPSGRRGWRPPSGWFGSRGSRVDDHRSCRAASGSGSRSPGRSSTARECCCSTSHSARWT